MFDPYLEWLKIPSQRRPPSHYDLLGLPDFEQDVARIHQAAMDRMALVRRYQLGEHSETVIRMLGELSRAFDCLSDSQRKRAYDDELRAATKATVATPEAPTARPSAVAGPQANAVSSPSRPTRRLRFWLVGGGLIAATVALAIWFNRPAPSEHYLDPDQESVTTTDESELPLLGTATDAAANPAQAANVNPRRGRDPHIRYFGYATAGPPRVIEKIAPYTNVVLVRDWVDRNNELIQACEEAHLPVVLCPKGKEMAAGAKALDRILSRRPDTVLAVCWIRPYLAGYKPSHVANVGRSLKQNHPGVEFWLAVNDTPRGPADEVPAEVDALMIMEPADDTPEAVRAKEKVIPMWIAKAEGRPIYWCWTSESRHPKGIVKITAKGTFRACLDLVRRHQLAGLFFDRYGDPKGQERVPIDNREYLVDEIRQISGELGFDTALKTPAVLTAAEDPKAGVEKTDVKRD